MKRLLILTLGIVFAASAAFGQAGFITAYSDAGGTNCEFNGVTAGGLMQLYLFHDLTPGATASQFQVNMPIAYTPFGFISPFALVIGDPLSGVAISYGGCLVGPIYLGVVNGLAGSPPAGCDAITIGADPAVASGNLEVVDCGSNLLEGAGSTSYINADGSCTNCGPVPVSETSWGKVKALYN